MPSEGGWPLSNVKVAMTCGRVVSREVSMAPGIRSSGTIVQTVQQSDGRYEVIAVQINVVPVSSADTGHMDLVASAVVNTFNPYETTMDRTEIISALRYTADQLEAQQG
jgi:hypothetical protein